MKSNNVEFLRFAGFGRQAKELNDQEIVELYKKVKEQLQESDGTENPVLESSEPGQAPMADNENEAELTPPSEPVSGDNTIEAPVTNEPESTENAEQGPASEPASEEGYDAESDEELQGLLNELGLGEDEPANDTGTGDVSDASGASLPPAKEDESLTDSSIQVNSSEEQEELTPEQLKTMFGVAPSIDGGVKEAGDNEGDVFGNFLDEIAKEHDQDNDPEMKEASVEEPVDGGPIQQDELLQLGQERQERLNPSIEQQGVQKVEVADNAKISRKPLDNREVDIGDFTIAGKGRLASKGFQLNRKDKDTMADGITKPDADRGTGMRPPREDLQSPFGSDFKEKAENKDADLSNDPDMKG